MKIRSLALPAFIFLLFTHHPLFPQRYGLPGIRNFSKPEYLGGTQNWAMAQAANGLVYFGNNHGLLEFDGAHWNLYQDMESVVRSVCIDGKRIYTGAFNKFGYYREDSSGTLRYHSLLPLLKGRINDFDEIWRIYKTSFGIVFQSFKALFIYTDNRIDIVYPRSRFHFSFYVNGILWLYDESEGLMQYREGKVRQVPQGSFFKGTTIWSVLPLNDDEVIIGTTNKGLFWYDGEHLKPWSTQLNQLLKQYQLFSGHCIDRHHFAFGTIQNGLLVTDTSGTIIYELNKERGLLNNTVLCVGNDQEGNIWLGLDNGIAMVRFNSALTYVQNYFNIGSGYASALYNGLLYLGTNQGLFCIPWNAFINPLKKKEDFRLIPGTEGQVWNLSVEEGILLCGHNSGVFRIQGQSAIPVSTIPGGWNFTHLKNRRDLLLVGTYSGISILEKRGGQWVFRNHMAGYDQSSHYLETDDHDNIWVSQGYKGIFRITTDPDFRRADRVRLYNSKDGLPKDMGNSLFRIHNAILVTTRNGIFSYHEGTDKFSGDTLYPSLISNLEQVDYMMQDRSGNIWFYNNQQVGVLRLQEDGPYKNIVTPFAELSGMLIPPFGHVNVLEENIAIIGTEGGFALYHSGQLPMLSFIPRIYLSRINSGDTSEGSYRFTDPATAHMIIPAFRFKNNNISIAFAGGQFSEKRLLYKTRLDGFDPDWSDWTQKNTREYTNLPPGNYTFEIKALTLNGQTTPVLNYRFRILPPWYRTVYAMVIYLILLILFVAVGIRFMQYFMTKSRQKEQAALRARYLQREQQLKEEALVAEKEMIRLRNDALNLEMVHKEKELANSTMLIIQKNEILQKLREDMNRLKEQAREENLRNDLNTTIRRISREIDNEKQWQVFNTHVEQVHEDFFRIMKSRFPDLTPRELSLCAYLKMNISSKEIATLMNISTRGVEISRYRIRKKLNLDRNANLTEFMLGIQ